MNFKQCCLFYFIIFLIGCKPIEISTYQEPQEQINSNNKIYKEGVKVSFDYYFIDGQDTFKCNVLAEEPWSSSRWQFVMLQDTFGKKQLIDKIDIEITGGQFYTQTEIAFNLLYPSLKPFKNCETRTGLIENEHRVWTHPIRIYEFNILEFNPFPEIRFPLRKGVTWTDTITPYPSTTYNRWIEFDKPLDCVSTYKIVDKTQLTTNLGVLTCYVTDAVAVNSYAKGYLTSYFNEKYGFVKLEYTNIDGSRLVMNVVDFQEGAIPK